MAYGCVLTTPHPGGRASAAIGKAKKKREGSAQQVTQDKVPLIKEALEVMVN